MDISAADRPAGLCETCRHARDVRSSRNQSYVRCGLSDRDPAFPRYPILPVWRCTGYDRRDAD